MKYEYVEAAIGQVEVEDEDNMDAHSDEDADDKLQSMRTLRLHSVGG